MENISNSTSQSGWYPLNLSSIQELSLDKTLRCGQSFRWKRAHLNKDNALEECWLGVIGETVYGLQQRNDEIYYTTFPASLNQESEDKKAREQLRDYLRLDISLESLYKSWCSADQRFQDSSVSFVGIRLLRQPPVECLFSFICSQNNNIARITKMIDALCEKYGTFLCKAHGHSFYTFPSLEQLAAIKEESLRELGFGYRARYIVTAAQEVIDRGGEKWLHSLRANQDRKTVQKELIALMGIGKKVADCVSLFALDQLECIPVDTHVWQIAQMYMPKLKGKRLNDQLYEEIGEFFKQKFTPYCGWAHSVLFAADLGFFKKELLIQQQSSVTTTTTSLEVSSSEETKTVVVTTKRKLSLTPSKRATSSIRATKKKEESSDSSSESDSDDEDYTEASTTKSKSFSQRRRKSFP